MMVAHIFPLFVVISMSVFISASSQIDRDELFTTNFILEDENTTELSDGQSIMYLGEETNTIVPGIYIDENDQSLDYENEEDPDRDSEHEQEEKYKFIISTQNTKFENDQNNDDADNNDGNNKIDHPKTRENITTSSFMTNKHKNKQGHNSVCTKHKQTPLPNTIVKCQCQGNEIIDQNGNCQNYSQETLLKMLTKFSHESTKVPVSPYKVLVKDLSCTAEDGIMIQFTREEFVLGEEEGILLTSAAGRFAGLLITNYCISNLLDENGYEALTVKACIPVPVIPRCCPSGQAMKDGLCQTANSPEILTPPIATEPFSSTYPCENVSNSLNPLSCSGSQLKTYPLSHRQSHLVIQSEGLSLGWLPIDSLEYRAYKYCPDFCIDGIEDKEGTIDYFTSFCYSSPEQLHKEQCEGQACIRMCCKPGESMSMKHFNCVPDPDYVFNPNTSNILSHYSIVTGWPICTPTKLDGDFAIDEKGILIYKDKTFAPTDYCVDSFLHPNSLHEQSALACLHKSSTWRLMFLPVCKAISLVFLSINILCHLLVPNLLKNGGTQQLCHAIALCLAYAPSFSINVFHHGLTNMGCFMCAVVMQFGFLSTSFWLNVMCWEIWRKVRSLKKFRQCKSYPMKYFVLYAWGIPLVMCIIAVAMKYLSPDYVPGLLKPQIAISWCWFQADLELFAYFHFPIAVIFASNGLLLLMTQIDCKTMVENYKEVRKTLKTIGDEPKAEITKTRKATKQERKGVIKIKPEPAPKVQQKQISNHVQEFKQKLRIFVIMAICYATCWSTELVAWKLPEIQFWAPADSLSSLQGLFIFLILLSNRNKRNQIEEKFPTIFKYFRKIIDAFISVKNKLCKNKKPSNKLQHSKFGLPFYSSTSFDIGNEVPRKRSEFWNQSEDNGIVVLSHSTLKNAKSFTIS